MAGGLVLFASLIGRRVGISPEVQPFATQANLMWRISHGRAGRIVGTASSGGVVVGALLLLIAH